MKHFWKSVFVGFLLFGSSVGFAMEEIQEEIECPICQLPVIEAEMMVTLCNHRFHDQCIQGWIQGQNKMTCPLCRQQMVEGPVNQVQNVQLPQNIQFPMHLIGLPGPGPLPENLADDVNELNQQLGQEPDEDFMPPLELVRTINDQEWLMGVEFMIDHPEAEAHRAHWSIGGWDFIVTRSNDNRYYMLTYHNGNLVDSSVGIRAGVEGAYYLESEPVYLP